MPPFRRLLVSTLLVVVTASCPSPSPKRAALPGTGTPGAPVAGTPAAPAGPRDQGPLVAVPADAAPGLELRVHEISAEDPAEPRARTLPGTPLADADAAALLARLPAIVTDPDDARSFALRESSLPPPRTGRTIAEVFPPAAAPPAPDASTREPLTVLRHAPDGDVALAPHLSITFSQPMVALTALDDLAASAPPVVLEPQPPGKWRWVGTRTLLFEPSAGRLPMATDYVVTVPAGTRSALGHSLAAEARWKFSTPVPEVTTMLPQGGPQRREPIAFVAFDQAIDPAAVLATIRMKSSGKVLETRAATAAEVAADPVVARVAESAQAGRWLAFRASAPLDVGARVDVDVGPGTPSAEGPRRSLKAYSFKFAVYGPMRMTDHECGWGDRCRPLEPWSVSFSNPIDGKKFDKTRVKVEPALPGMKVAVTGQYFTISGYSRGRTTYHVSLPAGVPDTFGQTSNDPIGFDVQVGAAPRSLAGPEREFAVLDPASGARLSIYTTNHKSLRVRLWSVKPEDYPRYKKWIDDGYCVDGKDVNPAPGKLAFAGNLAIRARADDMVETLVDLAPALDGGLGHVIAMVEPPGQPRACWKREYVVVWAQSTHLGLSASIDESTLAAWTTALDTGKPEEGVEVSLLPAKISGRSGADGLTELALPTSGGKLLLARKGKDVAFLPEESGWWSEDEPGWHAQKPGTSAAWYVAEDRGLYKPGETVKVKGWIRSIDQGKGGDVKAFDATSREVAWQLHDQQGREVVKGTTALTALGGFDLSIALPRTMNLGYASLLLSSNRQSTSHPLRVEEFRRPEYEVKTSASEGPYLVGLGAEVTVSASYFAGGGLQGADVLWSFVTQPGSFSPPGRDEFAFGPAPEWIERPWRRVVGGRPQPEEGVDHQQLSARTDATGKSRVGLDFLWARPERPYVVHAQATVQDVNRQSWSSSSELLVHPARVYAGVRLGKQFYREGDVIAVEAIAADLDGKLVAGRVIDVTAVRLEWQEQGGEWERVEVDAQTCKISSAPAGAARCDLRAKKGGQYKVSAVVSDERGRRSLTTVNLWVTGAHDTPDRGLSEDQARLIQDKPQYRAGDNAEILVVAPWFPAEGLMTVRRSGVLRSERFTMSGPTQTLHVKIDEGQVPDLFVHVDLVGQSARQNDAGEADARLPARPAFASGEVTLDVPPLQRTLAVAVEPGLATLEPGGQTDVTVKLTDAKGAPVAGGEVAIVVVDEAVLALTGYHLPDPIATFYAARSADVTDLRNRELVLLARPDLGAAMNRALEIEEEKNWHGNMRDGGGGGYGEEMMDGGGEPRPSRRAPPREKASNKKGGRESEVDARVGTASGPSTSEPAPPVQLRTDMSALALFVPAAATDAGGRATVKVKLPDNLTRYRVMAVAVSGAQRFGQGESTITARLPLMLRPSPPRFLNFGDRFELPVVLQNQSSEPLDVAVALRASNATLTGPRGKRVTVPAHDRVEIRFPVAAAMAGTARFQLVAASGRYGDASELSLPVWTPATTEAFAVYGVVDEGAVVQPFAMPSKVVPSFGGLELTTSSTALQALTDAVIYLVHYPYDCAEQVSSRVMAIAVLRDVLSAFQSRQLPAAAALDRSVTQDIDRLEKMQNSDGGWGFWKRGERSSPYLSIHVAHALARARAKKYTVADATLKQALAYLRNIEYYLPRWYGNNERRAITAYALYVRAALGDADAARARKLIGEAGGVDKLPLEAVAWLWTVLHGDKASETQLAAMRKLVANRVEETAGAAHFTSAYSDAGYVLLHSDRRVDALLLEALILDQPKSDLIPKLVEGLLAHRTAGHWASTQENAFVLVALDQYFRAYEKIEPDFVARAWLGSQYVGEHAFKGRSTDRSFTLVPMAVLAKLGTRGQADIALSKEGPGRLYYRLGLRYAPSDLRLPAYDAGFAVQRVYEGVDDARDVRRDADGTWHVRAGARVRVRLTMVAPARRYHVALVDPLPAGLEAQNPALATTGAIPQDPADPAVQKGFWWWTRPWYEHQAMRDERVEAFTTLLWEGVHTYSYVTLATTPGRFIVPPPKAEEMYHPETFGRGAGAVLIVE